MSGRRAPSGAGSGAAPPAEAVGTFCVKGRFTRLGDPHVRSRLLRRHRNDTGSQGRQEGKGDDRSCSPAVTQSAVSREWFTLVWIASSVASVAVCPIGGRPVAMQRHSRCSWACRMASARAERVISRRQEPKGTPSQTMAPNLISEESIKAARGGTKRKRSAS